VEWFVLAFLGALIVCLLVAKANGASDKHWIAIRLEDITEIQNQADKPCKPEVELKRTQLHPEGEVVPTGWADCEKVRVKFRAITVMH
jgi:hypothetical protein